MTLSKEQKAAIGLSIIALFVIIPQSYAAWCNSSVETQQYFHLLDSTLLLNSATASSLSYEKAISILQNLTNDILLVDFQQKEVNHSKYYKTILLPKLNESQKYIKVGNQEVEYHNNKSADWQKSYDNVQESVKFAYDVNRIAYGITFFSFLGGLIYINYLFFSKSRKTNYRQKNWLESQINQGKTTNKIAKECRVTTNTINKWIKKHKL